jgi:hypothetical protein
MTNPGVNATRSAAHVIATTGHHGNERVLPLSLAVTCQRPGTDRDQPGTVGATRHDTTEKGEAPWSIPNRPRRRVGTYPQGMRALVPTGRALFGAEGSNLSPLPEG